MNIQSHAHNWRLAFPALMGRERDRDYAAIPMIIAGVTAVASATAAGVSAAQQAANARAASKAEANQAVLAEQQSKAEAAAGASQEGVARTRNAAVEGSQFAAIAQSGIGVTSGSAQDVMRSTAINNALDALNIRYAGQLTARGYAIQGQEEQTASNIDRANASNLLTAGYFGVGKSLLSDSSGVYSAYKDWSGASAPTGGYTGGIR